MIAKYNKKTSSDKNHFSKTLERFCIACTLVLIFVMQNFS